MLRKLLPAALFVGLGAGCYGETDVGVGYAAAPPSLAYVSPGVSVVYDYDYPVFYADNYYWRWSGGYWYSSPYWDRGWSVSYNVPVGVRGISRPEGYRHYRSGTIVRRGPAVRDHRGRR